MAFDMSVLGQLNDGSVYTVETATLALMSSKTVGGSIRVELQEMVKEIRVEARFKFW
jgi:hypothetical protein